MYHAAGYYRYVPLNETEAEFQFRPLVLGLDHDEADLLARLMGIDAHLGFDHLKQVGNGIERMTKTERREFFGELRVINLNISPSGRDHDLDIGL